MAVRNSKELGQNLVLIAKRLLNNQDLLKLLIYTNSDPLSGAQIEEPFKLLHKNVKVVPIVNENDFKGESKIVLLYSSAVVNGENQEFKDLELSIAIYTPLDQWILNSEDLRPFLIMSKIEESLKGKRINGLGTIQLKGSTLKGVTSEVSCYLMEFSIDIFN